MPGFNQYAPEVKSHLVSQAEKRIREVVSEHGRMKIIGKPGEPDKSGGLWEPELLDHMAEWFRNIGYTVTVEGLAYTFIDPSHRSEQ